MVAWVEVLVKMVDAPSVPIQGTIRRTGLMEGVVGFAGDIPPVFVSGLDDLQVWRDGSKIRVETSAGKPVVIGDGSQVWSFAYGGDVPIQGPQSQLSYQGPGSELLTSRPASGWVGDDFTTPVGPIDEIEFLGRACWSFDLAPPSHKPHPMQMVVDQLTGMVLEQRNDGFDHAVSFVEFTAGIPIDASIFEWTGDVTVPDRDFRRLSSVNTASLAARRQEELDWFRDNVTTAALTIPITADLDVVRLQSRNDDGEFVAMIGTGPIEGRLARRRRSTLPWDEPWQDDAQTWSTPDHDWAIDLFGLILDDAALADLRQRLHPGVEVIGVPDIDS